MSHVDPAVLADADQALSEYTDALNDFVAEARKDLDAGVDPTKLVAGLLGGMAIARIVDPNYCGKLHGLLAVAVVRMAQQPAGAS